MNSGLPPTRISQFFRRLRRDGKKGLIAYITAGDPSLDETVELALALERGGAGLIELGVPFSDPVADGPAIQAAMERALKAGTNLRSVIETAKQIRGRSEVPLLLFSYLNPILHYGLERLAQEARAAGIDGCLITDLSVDEAHGYVGVMHSQALDTVFLAAPTSTPRRLELVARYSTGFVYLVSQAGVTGERESLSSALEPLVASMRRVTAMPLAAGFGISTPEQVFHASRLADAVVVGSAFVRLIQRNIGNASLAVQLESLARELKHGFELKAP